MILRADARALPLRDGCIDCVVTSPPYWGLRDYGTATWDGGDPACDHAPDKRGSRFATPVSTKQGSNAGSGTASRRDCDCGATRRDAQLGLEPTPEAYVAALVAVFREVARVLKPAGTVWCNLGDAYCSGTAAPRNPTTTIGADVPASWSNRCQKERIAAGGGLKAKDLVGIPWRVAFALQADGWYLRSDIIWHKPNPMPESVTDRPTKAHEYVFLLTRSERYFYDAAAIAESLADSTIRIHSSPNVNARGTGADWKQYHNGNGHSGLINGELRDGRRNKRSVWTIPTMPYSGFTPNYDEADYVGPDGKPYKASGDCLVHAPLAGRRSQQKAAGGEQLDRTTLRSLDSDARRVSRLIVEHASNVSRRSEPSISESVLGRSLESTGDYRTHSEPMPGDGLGGDDAARYHTNRTEVQSTLLADSPDCLSLGNAVPAMSHSNGNRKTGRALVTTAPYSPCEQTSIGIDDTSASRGSDSVGHTDANKSAEDFVLGGPVTVTERNQPRTARSDSPSCKCSIVGTDHFATMPEALVEPCILAGCPLGGLVLDPFLGSGTVGAVAERLGRRWVGTDLSYQPLSKARTAQRGIRFDEPEEVAGGEAECD